MASLYTFIAFTLGTRVLGALGITRLNEWTTSLRAGLAGMFLLTGTSHFIGKRDDLIAMVPPALPEPALLVTLTGIAELVGAVGLLHRRAAPWAAAGLGVLLVMIFPANLYASASNATIGGEAVVPILPRSFMQLLYVAATAVVARPLLDVVRVARRVTPATARKGTVEGASADM